MTSSWYIKIGKEFESVPKLLLSNNNNNKIKNIDETLPEFLGIPIKLLPLYLSFMLDSIATGLAMPLLPFYIMELGANAFQLSLVISSNYVAQAIGCIVMGRVSDKYGRKVVLLCCLTASFISYTFVSRAQTVIQITAFRIISGIFGGLLPVMQSSVADVSNQTDRPKYLGRIMATFGMGFVLGPALSACCSSFSTRDKIQLSAILPLIGLLIASLFFKETKKTIITNDKRNSKVITIDNKPISKEVLYLIFNGFLIMYAFGTETIYAMWR
jgi:MFS family permease